MIYISDSSDSDAQGSPRKKRRSNNNDTSQSIVSVYSQISWEHCSPPVVVIDSSENSLSSSILHIRSHGQLASAADTWTQTLGGHKEEHSTDSSDEPDSEIEEMGQRAAASSDYDEPIFLNERALSHKRLGDFIGAVFGRNQQYRSRAGPMDVDTNENDTSWLTTLSQSSAALDDRSKRRRGDTDSENKDSSSTGVREPVFGNVPFTFSMPPVDPEPMDVDWTHTTETPRRNQDNQPISPNAVRRIYSRRKNLAAEKRTRSAIRKERLQRQKSEEEDRDGHFSSESGSDFDSDSEGQARMSTESRRKQEAREVRRRRAKRRGTSEVLSRGVDKVLALMGSKTNVPVANDRLQMHRDIPYVVSGYLQVTVNTAVITLFGYLVLQAILAVSSEMSHNMDQSIVERKRQIEICRKDYSENFCGTPTAAPRLKEDCAEWKLCMNQNPASIGRAKIAAATLAGIINGFIDPISFKTMAFFMIMFLGTIYVTNFALGSYRQSRVDELIAYLSRRSNRTSHDQSAERAAIEQTAAADRHNSELTF